MGPVDATLVSIEYLCGRAAALRQKLCLTPSKSESGGPSLKHTPAKPLICLDTAGCKVICGPTCRASHEQEENACISRRAQMKDSCQACQARGEATNRFDAVARKTSAVTAAPFRRDRRSDEVSREALLSAAKSRRWSHALALLHEMQKVHRLHGRVCSLIMQSCHVDGVQRVSAFSA